MTEDPIDKLKNESELQEENLKSAEDDSSSLASKYSRSTGYLQSLSLVLNAALMLYAHLGVSGIIYSNQPRVDAPSNTTTPDAAGLCTAEDSILWNTRGGANNRSAYSSFCSQKTGCLVDVTCNTNCFVENFGYSTACAGCFAALPLCGLQNGCAFLCSQDSQSSECRTCNIPCQTAFENCTGFTSGNRRRYRVLEEENDKCHVFDVDASLPYYQVYEIKFLKALQDAWNGDAKLLAFLVVIFSGIWPYLKNMLLMVAWITPSVSTRASILKWLKRLGKYTLVDVYVVLILLVGVWLQGLIGETPIQIRGEAHPAIIAFLLATIWEFVHIEWMGALHHKSLFEKKPMSDGPLLAALQFQNAYNSSAPGRSCRNVAYTTRFVWLLWVVSMVLYCVGSPLDLLRFQTTEGEQREVVCERSYNLYSLGTELLSDLALRDNSAKPGIWTLCIAYLLLVVVSPLLVHLVQLLALLGVKNATIFQIGDSIWTFASVEVLLIGVYIVQYKFDALINRLAGGAASGIFGVNGDMGQGFFVLLSYSICSGFLQYFINSAVTAHFNLDPYHKVDFIWTKLLGDLVLEETPCDED